MLSVAGAGHMLADAPHDLNIRTVNILDMMRESEEGKKVSNELDQLRKSLMNDLEVAQKDFMKETEELKTKAGTLSKDAIRQTEERLIAKRSDIENQAKKSEDRLKYSMQSVSDQLMSKAQVIIDKYAEENKLDLVWDTASGRPLYSSAKVDITGNMITAMNSEYKKELAQNKTSKPETTKVAAKSATPAKPAKTA